MQTLHSLRSFRDLRAVSTGLRPRPTAFLVRCGGTGLGETPNPRGSHGASGVILMRERPSSTRQRLGAESRPLDGWALAAVVMVPLACLPPNCLPADWLGLRVVGRYARAVISGQGWRLWQGLNARVGSGKGIFQTCGFGGGAECMASYHLSVKTIKRSAGRSATAAAAYRAGAELECEREGRMHDYRAKQGVRETFIVAPDDAPEWASNRSDLWNAAEARENRRNSVTAREWELALPADISGAARREIAESFAQELVARYGVVADVAIHDPHKEGDQRNHHAHVLTTTRVMGPDGLTDKTRILDAAKTGGVEIEAMRAHWADLQNLALEGQRPMPWSDGPSGRPAKRGPSMRPSRSGDGRCMRSEKSGGCSKS